MQKVKGYVVFIRIKKTIQVFFLSFGTCQPIVRHVSASCLARVSLSFVMYRPIVRRSTNIHAPFNNNCVSFDKQSSDVRRTMTKGLVLTYISLRDFSQGFSCWYSPKGPYQHMSA